MLRKWILGCAALAMAVGVIVASPDNAWARRCCNRGRGYASSSSYRSSGNYAQPCQGGTSMGGGGMNYSNGTYSNGTSSNYGTNYGPQGTYSQGNGPQNYESGGNGLQGGVDANGRALNQNNGGVRGNSGVDINNRNNSTSGQLDANGIEQPSARVNTTAPPAPPAPATQN